MTPQLTFPTPPTNRPYSSSTPAPDALMEFPDLAQPDCTDYSMIQGKRFCKNSDGLPLCFCENLVKMGMCPKGKKKEG